MADRHFPLLFSFREVVSGTPSAPGQWSAGVLFAGRALMIENAARDEWSLVSVEPGGLAAIGDSPAAARLRFREEFSAFLFDVASECSSLGDFHRSLLDFVANDVDESAKEEWGLALVERRRAHSTPLPDAVASLNIVTAPLDFAPDVRVLDPPCTPNTEPTYDVATAA